MNTTRSSKWFLIPTLLVILTALFGLGYYAVNAEGDTTSVNTTLNLPGEDGKSHTISVAQNGNAVSYSEGQTGLGHIPNSQLVAPLGNSSLIMSDAVWFGGFSAPNDPSPIGFHKVQCGQNPNPIASAQTGSVDSDARYGTVITAVWNNASFQIKIGGNVILEGNTGSWNTSITAVHWTYIVDAANVVIPTAVFVLDATLAEIDGASSPGMFFVMYQGGKAFHQGHIFDSVQGTVGSSGLIGFYSNWSGSLDEDGDGISFARTSCKEAPPTAVPSSTATSTATATASPSPSPSATATGTATATPSPSASPSPSPTGSSTPVPQTCAGKPNGVCMPLIRWDHTPTPVPPPPSPTATNTPIPSCPSLFPTNVKFGWSRSSDSVPTEWYAPGDAYPTQTPGTFLWLNLTPLASGYYIVTGEFQPWSGDPDVNYMEVYPGAGGHHVGWTYLVDSEMQPGFAHLVIFKRQNGLDCELGQLKLKIDDAGPSR